MTGTPQFLTIQATYDWAEMETLKKDLLSAVAQEILVLHAPLNLALNS